MGKKEQAPAPQSSRKRGFQKAMFRVTPEHLELLRTEALRRAAERHQIRADGSEIVREALDEWFGRHLK